MIAYYKTLGKQDRLFFWLAIAVILLGVALRLAYWFANRDLIIDEANIARNLFERDYSQLATRLDYEQYAPILFMWIEKTFTMFFGFSEQSLRAYPLLCSIASLFVFMMLLKEFMSIRVIWYPLLYMAVAHFFSRYATEVKQYAPDVLITLLLIWLALKNDILTKKPTSFFFTWLIAGSISVWASMPSVFVLLGIGIYYFGVCVKAKQLSKFFSFVLVGLLCFAQFAMYYQALLKQDAHSDYLQNFHKPYFLYFSHTWKGWKQNYYIISDIPKIATGTLKEGILLNMPLLLIGTIVIIRKYPVKAILILTPLVALIAAAFLKEFSLIPRVVLFSMPLFMLLIGVGLNAIFSLRIKVLNIVMTLVCLFAVTKHHDLKRLVVPFESENITAGLQLMVDHHIEHKKLHVSHGSYPAYLYYTTMHPEKQKWFTLSDATHENWDADWWMVSSREDGRFGVLFTTTNRTEARIARMRMEHDSENISYIEDGYKKICAYIMQRYPKD